MILQVSFVTPGRFAKNAFKDYEIQKILEKASIQSFFLPRSLLFRFPVTVQCYFVPFIRPLRFTLTPRDVIQKCLLILLMMATTTAFPINRNHISV